ncbi:hypothetical protein HU200_063483 [Digitaria exilis]|uniref:Uncharacterized protein n=1 Tax=Digitaria exilis TaxID=1010633 RepID=A0A835AB10_9POAL|nr:hypothetical protein HU200_063483 [Digitaria exilis]
MGADVTFDVGVRAFPGAQGRWRREIFGGMMEKDVDRIKVFGMLRRFIYTESLPGEGGCDAATMRGLMVAAFRLTSTRDSEITCLAFMSSSLEASGGARGVPVGAVAPP